MEEQKIKKIHTMKNFTKNSNETCIICNNTGWEIYEKKGYFFAKECRCGIRKKQITENYLSFANIPENFENVNLKNFDLSIYTKPENQKRAKIAFKAAEYWLNEFENMNNRGMGLYFYSEAKGSGKTRMAISIANELLYSRHIQIKFCTSLQILNEIKSTWNKESVQTEEKLLSFLSKTEVLIIDDFGIEQLEKPWITDRFYSIINSRYMNKKITLFTSNRHVDQLECDERIADRIKECTFQIPFPEESIRKIIATENMNELIAGIKRF